MLADTKWMSRFVVQNWLLLLVSIALFGVYAVGASERSIWFDEAMTLSVLSQGLPGNEPVVGYMTAGEIKPLVEGTASPSGVLNELIMVDVHPYLYFVLSDAWTFAFGDDLFVLRLFSVLMAALAVFVFHQLVTAHAYQPSWIYTAVFASSFLVATSAHEARYQALMICLSTVAVFLSLQPARLASAASGKRVRNEIWFGLATAGLFLSHYFGAFLVVPLMAERGIRFLVSRKPIFLIAPVVSLACVLPWLGVTLNHLTARPEQGQGFESLFLWVKASTGRILDALISPSLFDAHALPVQLGQWIALLGLVSAGIIFLMRMRAPRKRSLDLFSWSILLVGSGMLIYTVLLLISDKWLLEIRYYASFITLLAIIVPFGLIKAGNGAVELLRTRVGVLPQQLALAPVILLIALQVTVMNFGYENTSGRDGNHWNSLREDVRKAPSNQSIVLVDSGIGMGNILSAAQALAPETEIFVLAQNSDDWPLQAENLAFHLADKSSVWIAYTINRGEMNTDKAELYSAFTHLWENQGFRRDRSLSEQRARHFALWTRDPNE